MQKKSCQTKAENRWQINGISRSVKVTHFRLIIKPVRYFMSLYSNVGLIANGSKDMATKITCTPNDA